jgi:hypothetical protein
MTRSVFLSNKLPISVDRARQILGSEVGEMDDDAVEDMIRRVTVAADVIISVIDVRREKVPPTDELANNK